MVIQACADVLLEKVAEGLKELATCYLQMPTLSSCCPHMKRLLLLQCRSKDVLSEFSGYYCLRLLLDYESPLATYFIDLFHQLEWLLEALLTQARESPFLPEELYRKASELLRSIKPSVNTCRYLFAFCRLSPTACSQWLSTAKEAKREGKVYRDFSLDDFRCLTKMLSFVNLDQCSKYNMVKLGKMLGSGGYADVYKGNFVTRNNMDRSPRITGEPVAVKVFKYGDCNESVGSSKSVGSQFFDQMEKMLELQKMKKNGHDTSSMTAGEVLLLEELWKLVSAKHPNIVTARGYIGNRPPHGESGLVMELMDTSLQDHLEKVEEALEELEMIDLMLEIAKGMRFLHECDLVHKDLKPRNILLRSHHKLGRCVKYPAMEVKLADFGLTQRFVQDVQQSVLDTTPAGTYCYMAPEVLHIADYKASYQDKVDVFSFGTTCFNILTCEVPGALEFTCAFSKAASAEFYEAVKSSDWRKWVEGKPEYLIDLIARCWDFDPSQRPTFATICSLLQRAMLCILSSPVINVTTLVDFRQNSKHNLLNLYQRIMWSPDVHYQVIGTSMMNSCLEVFRRDINACGHMRSNLSEDAALFLEAWNKITGSAARREEDAGVSSSKQIAAEETVHSKQAEAVSSDELFSAIDEANILDGSDSLTTPVIRAEVQEPTARFLKIPLKTMEPEWIVFKALVCSSMLAQFRSLDHEHYIQPLLGNDGLLKTYQEKGAPLDLFPFKKDNALSDLKVDESLIPFLMCFWEGCIGPNYGASFRYFGQDYRSLFTAFVGQEA